MRNYWVYFEFMGKKQKTRILAESEADAYDKMLCKLAIHKIEKDERDEFNQSMDLLDGVIDILTPKQKL